MTNPEATLILKTVDAALEKKSRKMRKECTYSVEERKVLLKHKERYIELAGTDGRGDYIKQKILPDIFNYWYGQGEIGSTVSTEEASERIKNLCSWMANNWRGPSGRKIESTINGRKMSYLEIIWRDREDEVLEVVKTIVKEDAGEALASGEDNSEPTATQSPLPMATKVSAADIFRYRLKAARIVYGTLTIEEKLAIKKKVDEYVTDPLKVRQKRPEKHVLPVIKKTAKRHWEALGVNEILFYTYLKSDGKLAGGMHDAMAVNRGSNERPFTDIHADLVKDVMKKLFAYTRLHLEPAVPVPEVALEPRPDLLLKNENGFPIMPPAADIDQGKQEIVDLLRRYLSAHYKMASGFRRSHIPFGRLTAAGTDFVSTEFLPTDFVWKDPHNMTKDSIIAFCNHIRERQLIHGPRNAFRFHQYWDGKMMVPAEYSREAAEAKAVERGKRQMAAGGRSRKDKEVVREGVEDHHSNGGQSISALAIQADIHGHLHGTGGGTLAYIPIDPQLQESSIVPVSPPPPVPHVLVDGHVMEVLKHHGYPSILPANGPNEGPPQYSVPATALTLLQNDQAQGDNEGEMSHKDRRNSRRTQKRTHNADAQTIKEANEFLKTPRRGRSKPTRQLRRR